MKDPSTEKEARGLSVRERAILGEFMRKRSVTLTSRALAKQFGMSRPLANKILLRLEHKGWLQRSRRGLYIFVPLSSLSAETMPEDPWALAMELFAPCYISGFSAAEYWELTEQIFNAVAVYTTRPQRRATQKIANITFRTHHIPDGWLFGTKKIWKNNIPLIVADLHRTLIDVFEYPNCGGGGRHALDIAHTYWKSGKAEPETLLDYALRLKRGVVFKRLGFTAELWGAVPAEWIQRCRSRITAGVSKLDPSGADKGRILTRWNLRINLPLGEYE